MQQPPTLDKTVIINNMDLHGPRAVQHVARRVCVPKALAAPLGLLPGRYASVRLSNRHEGELVVSVADAPVGAWGRQDPKRPRMVTPAAQFSLPSVLLNQVGVTRENPWVYFAPDEDGHAVRVIPAARVDARVSPRSQTQVVT